MKPSISKKPAPGQPNAAPSPASSTRTVRPAHRVHPAHAEAPAPAEAWPDTLHAWMQARRRAVVPRLPQLVLSRQLGFPYAVVALWENGMRRIYAEQFAQWAAAVGVSPDEAAAALAHYPDAVGADAQAGQRMGSRMDADVNQRLKLLRKKLGFSQVQMAEMTGISPGHLQRIEANQGNLSVAQVRTIHRRLRVNYEWLIDGVGEFDSKTLQDEVERLRREVSLLEELRHVTAGRV